MYSRVANPTVRMFEERLALLEGAEEAAATATGMAAVHAALMSQLRAGDRVVAARLLFGSCHYILTEILPRFGVEVVLVDGADLDAWAAALGGPTRLVFFETPGNPTLDLIDIAAVAELAHARRRERDRRQRVRDPDPAAAAGAGRRSGGVLGDQAHRRPGPLPRRRDPVRRGAPHRGPAAVPQAHRPGAQPVQRLGPAQGARDPGSARRASTVENALAVARFLEEHPGAAEVLYPGLPSHPQHELARRQMSGGGGVVALRTGGGRARAFAVLNRLKLIAISNNLGDAKSLITHPATTTHQRFSAEERARLGITDDLLRLSVGLEDPADLIEDLDQALAS